MQKTYIVIGGKNDNGIPFCRVYRGLNDRYDALDKFRKEIRYETGCKKQIWIDYSFEFPGDMNPGIFETPRKPR